MEAPGRLLHLLLRGSEAAAELQDWAHQAAHPFHLSDAEVSEMQYWLQVRAKDIIFAHAVEELDDLRSNATLFTGEVRRAVSYVARCEQSLRAVRSNRCDSTAVH